MARPANEHWNAKTTFPVGVFLASIRRDSAIRPLIEVHPVIGCIDNDGVFGDAKIIQFLQQLSYLTVMFDHAIVVEILAG